MLRPRALPSNIEGPGNCTMVPSVSGFRSCTRPAVQGPCSNHRRLLPGPNRNRPLPSLRTGPGRPSSSVSSLCLCRTCHSPCRTCPCPCSSRRPPIYLFPSPFPLFSRVRRQFRRRLGSGAGLIPVWSGLLLSCRAWRWTPPSSHLIHHRALHPTSPSTLSRVVLPPS